MFDNRSIDKLYDACYNELLEGEDVDVSGHPQVVDFKIYFDDVLDGVHGKVIDPNNPNETLEHNDWHNMLLVNMAKGDDDARAEYLTLIKWAIVDKLKFLEGVE